MYESLTNSDFHSRVVAQVERLKGKRDQLAEEAERQRAEAERQEARNGNALKARALVQDVAQRTQQKLERHVAGLVTTAEAAVFPEPYGFGVEFVQRRNKTECDLYFVKDGERLDPVSSSGGGALDVAAFALRCAFWSLKRTRPVIVLDEPFRFVSHDLQSRCGMMLKTISERLGLQVLMVSHLPNIISGADRVLRVTQEGGISKVAEVEWYGERYGR